jgi:hypothetical protein
VVDMALETEEEETLAVADAGKQEALDMMAEPDLLQGEQTWPTAEEEEEAAGMEDDDAEVRPLYVAWPRRVHQGIG